ncbi:hypothetical protein F2P79_007729 [Pimephales promelas]|nr:hypothetical protein F2P79_007729 [Pimephales promelas]
MRVAFIYGSVINNFSVLGRKRRISFLLLFGHSLAFVWTDSSGRKNFHPSFPAVGRRVIQQDLISRLGGLNKQLPRTGAEEFGCWLSWRRPR